MEELNESTNKYLQNTKNMQHALQGTERVLSSLRCAPQQED